MLNSKIIDIMMLHLQRKGTSFREILVNEINAFIEMREKSAEEPPWFLETVWTDTTLGASSYLSLPLDFLRELEESTMILTDSEGKKYELKKRNYDYVQQITAANPTQMPGAYAIFGNYLFFGPGPNKTYSFLLPYARKGAAFADNDSEAVDWLKEAYAGVTNSVKYNVALNILADGDMAMRYGGQATEAWRLFKEYNLARKYTNMSLGEVE